VSQRASTLVWDRSRVRRSSDLLVLLAIADYAHNDGRNAWPSTKTLAQRARCSERNVRRILERLERMGEIVLEPNTELRRPSDSAPPPPWFIHVRCVADVDGYFAGKQSDNLSHFSELFKAGRPRKTIGQPVRLPVRRKSDKSGQTIGQIGSKNRTNRDPYPLIQELDPRTKQEQGAAPPILPFADPELPSAEDCFNVVVKLAHEAFDRYGEQANEADLMDHVKRRCISLHIPTHPPVDLVGRAIDAARWQRKHRMSAS
jgi:helix-turn-helix protein